MSKLPELPDFFKKQDSEKPSEEIKKNEELKQEEIKIPEVPTQFPLSNQEDKMEQSEDIKTEIKPKLIEKLSLLTKLIIGLISVVILALAASTAYFYFEMKEFKDKYTAIDSRVLVLTKEIASLNQENNNLSGKVVSYQQELENIKQVDANSEQMQQSLIELESKNKELLTQIEQLQNNKPEVKPTVSKTVTAPNVITPKVNPIIAKPTTTNPLAEHLTNFESQVSTDKQKQCLAYFRNETLKRCTAKYPNLNQLTTVVKEIELNGQKIQKLVYKCQDTTGKGMTFKYGPLEMKNSCLK
jgi:hypothetical protein